MRLLLPLIKRETVARLRLFYCRMNNRTVPGCPMESGPRKCPVRQDCLAHAVEAGRPISRQAVS